MDTDPSGTPIPPPNPPPPGPQGPPPRYIYPSYVEPRPARGRGWMVFAIVLLLLLGMSFLLNLTQFMGGLFGGRGAAYVHTAGPKLEEVMLEQHGAGARIAVVEVEGIISSQMMSQGGYGMVEIVRAQLKRAGEDSRVKAVVMKVNSPGGEVLASDEISRSIAEFQKKTGKPVIASMGDLAASGGYYVSAPCRWIVANELTLTGSIGVIMSSWNFRGLMNKVGVRPEVYKSGKFKDMLSSTREPSEVTEEERDMLKNLIQQTYSKFRNVVATGRNAAAQANGEDGRSLASDWADYADGRVLSGADAHKLGFVDELGGFDDALRRARRIAGLQTADVVKYQQRYDLGDLLQMFGKTDARRGLKVDLGFDRPQLRSGQLYFLMPSAAE